MKRAFKIKVKEGAIIPSYETSGSSGMDLRAFISEPIQLAPNERKLIPTGISIQLEVGYEAQIRSRSGNTLKRGLVVANGLGTIDSDYTGDVGVILHNISDSVQTIEKDERIAQMVVAKYERIEWDVVDELNETERGSGGFGSTGIQ